MITEVSMDIVILFVLAWVYFVNFGVLMYCTPQERLSTLSLQALVGTSACLFFIGVVCLLIKIIS